MTPPPQYHGTSNYKRLGNATLSAIVKMISVAGALVLLLVASTLAHNDVMIDCKADAVAVKWRPVLKGAQKVDPTKAHLGTCSPSSSDENVLLFFVSFHDCDFRIQVGDNNLTYSSELTYGVDTEASPELVECVYDISGKKVVSKSKYDPVFRMEFMNSDFSGPAPSPIFTLGSRIAIKAEVEQQGPEPLQIYLSRCVLAAAPDLARASQLHTIISNSGCLTESKEGNSAFLPREKPSEIRFYFEASEFALGESVFIHCDMVAWAPQSFDADEKACHYLKGQRRWELLDDSLRSYICSCCDSACIQRSSFVSGLSAQLVLGPFTIVDDPAQSNGTVAYSDAEELAAFPVWLVVTIPLVLLLMAGAIATGYYLRCWRGGRLGYRPRRDLLTNYDRS